MIFVTVGTQFPFDRLIRTVDDWAVANGRTDIMAQTGNTDFIPRALQSRPFMSWNEFETYRLQASLMVSHAGMGSILGALEIGTPLVIMPRLAAMKEHRNDHQLATANHFRDTQGVYVANAPSDLIGFLNRAEELSSGNRISPYATASLVSGLNAFIRGAAAKDAGGK